MSTPNRTSTRIAAQEHGRSPGPRNTTGAPPLLPARGRLPSTATASIASTRLRALTASTVSTTRPRTSSASTTRTRASTASNALATRLRISTASTASSTTRPSALNASTASTTRPSALNASTASTTRPRALTAPTASLTRPRATSQATRGNAALGSSTTRVLTRKSSSRTPVVEEPVAVVSPFKKTTNCNISQMSQNSWEFLCPICLMNPEQENLQVLATACGHVMCGTCLIKIHNKMKCCPICQQATQMLDFRQIYF